MANYIKNLFGKFAKDKSSKSKITTEVIEVKTGNKLSYAGYTVGDTITQEQQASALLTELRQKTNIGEQIETIVEKTLMYPKLYGHFKDYVCKGLI